MLKTDINQIIESSIKKKEKKIKDEDLCNIIVDMSYDIDIKERIRYLNKIYKSKGYEYVQELINKLCIMYQFASTFLLKEFLKEISEKSKIHIDFKINTSKIMCAINGKDDLGYKSLYKICKSIDFLNVPTPVKIDTIFILMNNSKYKTKSKKLFCNIINNKKLDIDFRYKTILSLENKIQDIYFIRESFLSFINNENNNIRYKILAGQYLLRKCKLSKLNFSNIEKLLLTFATDNNLDHNLRSDSADVLLQLGTKDTQIVARDIIICLGRETGIVRSIFDNSQNVHSEDIDESLYKGLEFIIQIKTYQIEGVDIGFDYIKKHIEYYIEENKINKDDTEKISISLNRILMDRAVYGRYNMSLCLILIKIFSYIKQAPVDLQYEITKCLVQELVSTSGWCSTGYATRILNSISGFGDFNYTISWKEQIISNFIGRLNCKINNIKDLNYQEKIIEEMTINSSNYHFRKNFLQFFRENVLSIREELYLEFKEFMDDTTFDLYFRSAILTYENGNV